MIIGSDCKSDPAEITNLVLQSKTLQGIGLSGSYWYEDVHNLFKENPWRVINGIANLAYIDNEAWYKKTRVGPPARVLRLKGLFG
ncbi:hypothetical protein CLV31_1296 [Algoriphagus aquaeductus]|uniref:Uncharacterized protein n=1 Tax=Algoriphagus aquaeductus TaxID=475299 RepID=A0A326RJQ3_9BACT|nr:hypothetical protein CLV31_1296 [Algoriphagus aquaeductus]